MLDALNFRKDELFSRSNGICRENPNKKCLDKLTIDN